MFQRITKKTEKMLISDGASQAAIKYAKEIIDKVGENYTNISINPHTKAFSLSFGESGSNHFLSLTFYDPSGHCFYKTLSEATNGAVNLGTCSNMEIDNLIKDYRGGQ